MRKCSAGWTHCVWLNLVSKKTQHVVQRKKKLAKKSASVAAKRLKPRNVKSASVKRLCAPRQKKKSA